MKCTIVSFLPIAIPGEQKPGLYPGSFAIPASDGKEPSLLYVDNSITYVYLDGDRGSLPVRIPAEEVARSIVEDYCKSTPLYENGISSPGLFWVYGELTPIEIFKKHVSECKKAVALQREWFIRLVKDADDNWEKFHQLKMISSLHRFAADYLVLERPWNVDAEANKNTKCPACYSVIPAEAALCMYCKAIIDIDRYNAFTFANDMTKPVKETK